MWFNCQFGLVISASSQFPDEGSWCCTNYHHAQVSDLNNFNCSLFSLPCIGSLHAPITVYGCLPQGFRWETSSICHDEISWSPHSPFISFWWPRWAQLIHTSILYTHIHSVTYLQYGPLTSTLCHNIPAQWSLNGHIVVTSRDVSCVWVIPTWELPPGGGIDLACWQTYVPSGVSPKRDLSICHSIIVLRKFRIPPTRIETQSLYLLPVRFIQSRRPPLADLSLPSRPLRAIYRGPLFNPLSVEYMLSQAWRWYQILT